MLATSMLATMLLAAPAAADAPSPYAPLSWLAGHCWQGKLRGGKDVDTHCFTWVYDGKFVRDLHVVKGEGHADYVGETLYYWDGGDKALKYLYIENQGGSSAGAVETASDMLLFPPTNFQQDGKTQTYRSRWARAGTDAYDVVTEFKQEHGWGGGWTVHMEKSATP
jgi:hypothetical protein